MSTPSEPVTIEITQEAPDTVNITQTPPPDFSFSLAGPQGPQGAVGPGFPTGGTTGQVLQKVSSTDYDTQWQNPSGGSLSTLTDVNLSVSPANGQALVYDTATFKWKAGSVASGGSAGPLVGDSAWIDVATFQNAWQNYGGIYPNASYRKDALGVVHLRGVIKSGTVGQPAFTLPTGYRPSYIGEVVADTGNAGNTLGQLVFKADGTITPSTNCGNGFVYLDNIRFLEASATGQLTAGGNGSGTRVMLKEIALSAATNTITFDSSVIPTSGYRDLQMLFIGRSDQAAGASNIFVNINGDATDTNYKRSLFWQNEGGSGYGGNTADRMMAQIDGTTSVGMAAGTPTYFESRFPNFLGTTWNKGVITDVGDQGRGRTWWTTVRLNPAPITSITLVNAGGNFTVGTRVALYGTTDAAAPAGATGKDRRWVIGASGIVSIDEFNDDVLDPAWVRVDGTGAAAANTAWTEGADSLSVLQKGGDTTTTIHALVRPIGAPMVVGDAFITCLTLFGDTNANYIMSGLILADGTTHGAGNQVSSLNFASTAVIGNQANDTRGFTGFNTNPQNVGSFNTAAGSKTFVRLAMTAANTWRADVSPDGVSWITGSATLAKTLTPTHVGFLSSSWGTATRGVVSYEFLRRASGVS